MPATTRRRALIFTCAALLLTGCGSGMGGCGEKPAEVTGIDGTIDSHSGTTAEAEAPQYTTPTMDNLKGIPQQFPAKYPVRQYPNSRVVMAYVQPNLKPGQKNVVLLSSTDEKAAIDVFYRQNFDKDGWEMTYVNENVSFCQIIYTKKNPDGTVTEANVTVSPDPYGKRAVTICTGPYKKQVDYSHLDATKH